jgi:hypothetical protein
VLVSHDLESVRSLCERGIWIEGGHVCKDADVNQVIDAYVGAIIRQEQQLQASAQRWGSGVVEITRVEFFNGRNQPSHEFKTGQTLTAKIYYEAKQRIEHPVFGIAIYRQDGLHINGPNTRIARVPIDVIEGQGMVEYHIAALPLLDGQYLFSAAVYDATCTHAYDHHHMRYPFIVVPSGAGEHYGLLHIPSRWEHRPKL